MLGRIETRIRDRIYCQTIRTVRDISRDDRARIATCSLRKLTDILKENYSIDYRVDVEIFWKVVTLSTSQYSFNISDNACLVAESALWLAGSLSSFDVSGCSL